MDVREKLVELLNEMQDSGIVETPAGFGFTKQYIENDKVASHLFDNGASVQEWISVKDRLPDPDQDVILCTLEIETYGKHHEKKKIYRNIYIGYFDGDEWLTSYCHGCEYIFRMNEKYPNETIEVTHWMPLPQPPKGE